MFYNTTNLGGSNGPFTGPEFTKEYFNNNPGAAYNYWLSGSKNQSNSFQRYMGSQYSNMFGQYAAQSPFEPETYFLDYLFRQNPENVYGATPAKVRGEDPGRFSPKSRWVGF